MRESQLQIACVEILHNFALPNVIYLHVDNGGKQTEGQRIFKYRMGVLAGFPDFLLLMDGKPHFIEFKVGSRKLTEQQEKVRNRLKAQGLPYAVIRTVDGFIAQMKLWRMVREDIEISA